MIKIDIEKLRQEKLEELKNYVAELLAPTDYIIVKIAEAQALGNSAEVEALKQKYLVRLQQREAIRKWGEQMKQLIKNATSLEEFRSIVIQFNG
jgi:hypothetical protein